MNQVTSIKRQRITVITMSKITFLLYVFIFVMCTTGVCQVTSPTIISSPDKLTVFEVGAGTNGNLMYRMLFAGQEVTSWSALGFVLNDMTIGENAIIKIKTQKSHTEKLPGHWERMIRFQTNTTRVYYPACRLLYSSA